MSMCIAPFFPEEMIDVVVLVVEVVIIVTGQRHLRFEINRVGCT